jgi:hypothetical protein
MLKHNLVSERKILWEFSDLKIVSVFESCCFTILYNCLPTPILTNLKRNPFLQTESKAFWRSTKHANQRLFTLMTNKYAKTQFGFRENHRTSDSLFVLKTLINKYVHKNKRKLFVCFV